MTETQFPIPAYERLIEKLLSTNNKEALATALHCRSVHPDDPRTFLALARVHMSAERFGAALLPLQQAESLAPDDATVWYLLAECHNRIDDHAEAERYYRKVLAKQPDHVQALVRLEALIREQARYAEVRAILGHVRQIMPEIDRAVQTSIACLDLAEGRLFEGFQGYEQRFGYQHLHEAYSACYFPRWDGGQSLVGKRVLMRFEQGLGDTVQFVRYARHLKQWGAIHVGVLCKPVLHRLLRTCRDVDRVIGERPDGGYDFEVMMMSMPALLNTRSEADIPGHRYLTIPEADVQPWRERLASDRPRVGVVWSGELKRGKWDAERMNLRRSIPLDQWRPIFDVDSHFVSLQQGERRGDLVEFYTPHPIHDHMSHCRDFYDTAAQISALDLVITVDTAVAHVASALGIPVWMMSRLDGDWRWMLRRSDSPWYPSMTIFRQEVFLNWRPVIDTVTSALRSYTARYRPSIPTPHPP